MEEEIAQLVAKAVKDNTPEPKEVIFPDVQKVELTNPPDPPEMPKIDFSGTETVLKQFLTSLMFLFSSEKKETTTPVDMEKVEGLLEDVVEELKNVPIAEKIDHTKVLGDILEKLSKEPERFEFPSGEFFADLRKTLLAVPRGGGAIGPSKLAFKNVAGRVVNPAVAVKDGETLSTVDPQGTIIAGKDADGKAVYIKSIKEGLGTFNLSDRELVERQTKLLELISLKLNCLQVDEITEDDIET